MKFDRTFLTRTVILVVQLSSVWGHDFLEIVGREEWRARPSSVPLTLFSEIPRYVVICHTTTPQCFSKPQCTRSVRGMQNYHINGKKWSDIAYNFLISGDGLIYEGRGWDYVGGHSREWNSKSIGLSFIGDFRFDLPSPAQLAAAQKLLKFGVRIGKLRSDYKLVGRSPVRPTISPGDKLFAIIKTWPNLSELSAHSITTCTSSCTMSR